MWFVYQGSRPGTHYLGPYSSRDFVERTNNGEFDESVFVWTHGMEDWQQLSKQPDLELFFLELKAARETRDVKPVLPQAQVTLSGSLASLDFDNSPPAEPFANRADTAPLEVERLQTADVSIVEVDNSLSARAKRNLAPLGIAFAVTLAGGIWFSTATSSAWLPRGTVASEELDELTRAKSDSLRFSGPTAAIAVAKSDVTTPSFYVATNLPNESKLEFKIEGLAETLVDRFKYSMRTTMTVAENLAHTPVLSEPDGSAIKRGAYKVTVTESGQSKVLAQKIYFLGGAQDLSYQADLTRFHENIRTQAAAELEEISQLNETVSHQIAESNMRFSEIVRDETLNGPSRRHRWAKFQTTWNLLSVQFVAIIDSWTPTKIENDFYYSMLYTKLQKAAGLMTGLHEAQTRRLDAGADRPKLDAIIAKSAMNAQILVEEIRNQTERLKLKASQPPAAGASLPSRGDDGT